MAFFSSTPRQCQAVFGLQRFKRLNCSLTTLLVFTGLQELKMRNCGVLGALPASFARLTALTTLDLASNQITGSKPVKPRHSTR
jgi:hypothetical protein